MSAPALEAAVNRMAAKLAGLRGQTTGQVLAFMSCKGGSGATFLATNLGWQLAESKSVLLIDLDLQFGGALSYVSDGRPSSTIADVAHDISRLDASFLAASAVKVTPSFSILAAPEDPSKAMEVKPEHVFPTEKLVKSSGERRVKYHALERYFHGLLDPRRPLWLAAWSAGKPPTQEAAL